MSKYDPLWRYIKDCDKADLMLSFSEIESIAGVPIDHSFLKYKKELLVYRYEVNAISMKENTVRFTKLKN